MESAPQVMWIPLRPSGVTVSANQRAGNYTWHTCVLSSAAHELECGTLLLFIHQNLAPAVKENINLMHCINLGGH